MFHENHSYYTVRATIVCLYHLHTAAKMLLRKYQPELVQYINIEALLPYLVQQHLLTDHEKEVLLNEFLTHRVKVMKLLHFIECKGPTGFQMFLKAIANEPDHEGHKYIAEFFASFST